MIAHAQGPSGTSVQNGGDVSRALEVYVVPALGRSVQLSGGAPAKEIRAISTTGSVSTQTISSYGVR
jgi:hypothetical protein